MLVCEEQQSERLVEEVQTVWDKVAIEDIQRDLIQVTPENSHTDEAWLIQANVQFCATAYPAVDVSHPDAASLMILVKVFA